MKFGHFLSLSPFLELSYERERERERERATMMMVTWGVHGTNKESEYLDMGGARSNLALSVDQVENKKRATAQKSGKKVGVGMKLH